MTVVKMINANEDKQHERDHEKAEKCDLEKHDELIADYQQAYLKALDDVKIVERLKKRIEELKEFIGQLDDIRKEEDHMLSPVAGILEKGELEELQKILDGKE